MTARTRAEHRTHALLASIVIVAASSTARAQTGPTGGTTLVPRTPGGAPTPTPTPGAGANTAPQAAPTPGTPATGVPPQAVGTTPPASTTGSPLPLQATTGPTFTLEQALGAMARSHPQLLAAQANTDAARSDVTAAGLWTNPQFNVSYTHAFTTPGTGMQAYDPIGYINGGFSQLIETANLPGARHRAAEHALDAARNDGEATRRGLIFDVYAAFVTLTATAQRLAIMRDAAAQLEHASQIVEARVAAGASPHYDASRINIALADARAAVADAEADLASARGDFDVAVGPYAASLQGLPAFDLYNLPPLPPLAQLIDQMHNRPDLLAARQRAQSAGAQIDVARRSVFQGITLYVGAAFGTTDPLGAGHEVDGTVGVTLPLPFVDRGQGAIPAAEHRAQQAAFVASGLQLAAEQRITAIYNEVNQRRQALAAYRDAGVTQSAGMRREAEAGYSGAHLSVLELVDAYNSYRDALLRLVSLAADARTAEVNLGRATGILP